MYKSTNYNKFQALEELNLIKATADLDWVWCKENHLLQEMERKRFKFIERTESKKFHRPLVSGQAVKEKPWQLGRRGAVIQG